MKFSFSLFHKDENSRARLGEFRTPHGNVNTPVFMPVGTQATVKSLDPDDLNKLDTQITSRT
jgi:queuine tRNA-ribosyltransferase